MGGGKGSGTRKTEREKKEHYTHRTQSLLMNTYQHTNMHKEIQGARKNNKKKNREKGRSKKEKKKKFFFIF